MAKILKKGEAARSFARISFFVVLIGALFVAAVLFPLPYAYNFLIKQSSNDIILSVKKGKDFLVKTTRIVQEQGKGSAKQVVEEEGEPEIDGLSYDSVFDIRNIREKDKQGKIISYSLEEFEQDPEVLLYSVDSQRAFVFDSFNVKHPRTGENLYLLAKVQLEKFVENLVYFLSLSNVFSAICIWVLLLYAFRHPALNGSGYQE